MKKTTKATTTGKSAKATVAVTADGQVVAATTPKGKAAPAVVAKAGKAPKAATKAKALSPTAAIRAALAVDPSLNDEAISAALAKRGLNPPRSTVVTVKADFLGCLRALQAAGRVKLH